MNMTNLCGKMTFYKIKLLFVSVYLVLLGAAVPVQAGDLYVAPNGSDNVTRAGNSIATPWATIERAVELAEAGDVVNYRAGTYTLTSDTGYYTGNDGTAQNPIVHQSYNNESVLWTDGGFRLFINKNYWTFKNINMTSSGRFLTVGDGGAASNTVFDGGLYIPTAPAAGANNAVIYLTGDAINTTIKNIEFVGSGRSDHKVGVVIFRAVGVKVLNCVGHDLSWFIYYKHGPDEIVDTGIEFAYNFVYNSESGIGSSVAYANIHDNLFVNTGISMGIDAGNPANAFNNIHHNTFYNDGFLVKDEIQPDGNIFTDNIFGDTSALLQYSPLAHNTTTDYNLYPLVSAISNDGTTYDLDGWSIKNGDDVNSIEGSATYVGGAAPSAISDYALAVGSLGKNAASDGRDMGANIPLVGPAGFVSGLALPKPPTLVTSN